jgi:hypothetical protein
MEVVTYKLTFEGISTLVMHSNVHVGEEQTEERKRDPAAWEREHYLDYAYKNEAGQFIIPARAPKKALVNACKFLPEKPKGTNFKSFAPFIESASVIPQDVILDVTDADVRPLTLVVNLDPSKGPRGPRGPRTRPCFPPPWHGETIWQVFDPILKPDVLQRIADRAGTQCGLLDGRAIDFGRCIITVTPMK